MNTGLNDRQHEQLLRPLNPARVAKRSQAGRNLSYLEAWDVKAHLIRIFGFGAWSWHVISADLAFEDQIDAKNGGKQWSVGYRVIGTLTIPSLGCIYTEASVGFAKLPDRGEAHDMAIKTAESDALKRAAINLGTQFGLSLYNDGSTKDVVGQTLDRDLSHSGTTEDAPAPAVTDTSKPADAVTLTDTEGAAEWYEQITSIFTADNSRQERLNALIDLKKQMVAEDVNHWVYNMQTLGVWVDRAAAAITRAPEKN